MFALALLLPLGAFAQATSAVQRDMSSRGSLLDRAARLEAENVTLESALFQLTEASGVLVTYSPSLLRARTRRVTCECGKVTVREALDRLLAGTSTRPVELQGQVAVTPIVRLPLPAVEPSQPNLGGMTLPVGARVTVTNTTPPQGGTITGRITDARTGEPLASVQVYIASLDLGGLSRDNGRYLLQNVPVGTHTVTAQLLGYRTVTQEVTVSEDQTVVQDFQMAQQALQLNEIVVTGTPGGTQRRALGNDVPRLDASNVVNEGAPEKIDAVLAGRVPGVNVTLGTGNVGGGGQIRIRGMGSAALSNYPLIYVDGVRVSNAIGGAQQRDGNPEGFRLNDLDPNEIESIEIVKGPSAATLYGTEASAGVIQILTKRGSEGKTTFSAKIEQGGNFFLDPVHRLSPRHWLDPNTGALLTWHPITSEIAAGYPSPLSMGPIRTYELGARGGTDRVRYYVHGGHDYNQGYISYNNQLKNTLRTNLDALLTEGLNLSLSLGVISQNTEFGMHPSPFSLAAGFVYGHPGRVATRGWYADLPEEEKQIHSTSDLFRSMWSVKLDHDVTSWLTQRLIIGQDWVNEKNQVLFERQADPSSSHFGQRALGDLSRDVTHTDNRTLDYSITADLKFTDALSGKSSFGFQYYSRTEETETTQGQEFPAPGVSTLGAAARTFAGGTYLENKTVGMYVQQQVSWKNRAFLTAALRGDDNSAFGANYKAALYPKLSGSWVLDEESFWDAVPVVNSFRIRGAWGKAGRNPDVFAATTLYDGITGPGDQIALQQGSPGNPDLGPEVGEEVEVGFDAGLWNDRVSLKFTFYNKTTKDALLLVPVPMSTGFIGERWENVGELNNRGTELSLDASLIERPTFNWQMGFALSTNHNKVVSLGEVPPVIGTSTRTLEGYPLNGYWIPDVVDGHWEGDPLTDPNATPVVHCRDSDGQIKLCDDIADPSVFFRPQLPTWWGGINSTFTVFHNVTLYANVEFKGGNARQVNGLGNSHRLMHDTEAILGDPNNGIPPDPIVTWAAHSIRSNERLLFVHKDGFARLREISATYRFPETVSNWMHTTNTSLTLAARNLWFLWQEQKYLFGLRVTDPEMVAPGNLDNSVNAGMWPASTIVATLRVTF